MIRNILASTILLFASFQAEAVSQLEVSGELDVTASVWNLPTGKRGNTEFNIPSLFLNVEAPLKEDNLLVVTFEGSEQQTVTGERFDMRVREAYLDLVSVFKGMKALRLGLVPQPWQEAQYELWNYRFMGKDAWAITEKWKYLNHSDLGFSFMSQLPYYLGEWALSVANGEGGDKQEDGPHKEASLFIRFTVLKPWTLSLNYVHGKYDMYGDSVGLKERIQALLEYKREGSWRAGLEFLATRDPADALRDLKMAEEVDVLDLSGEAVQGQAGSLYMAFSTGDQSEVMLRYDYLNAVTDVEGKDLQAAMLAYAYQVSDDIRTALAVDYTRYGESFAPGLRDRSKVVLATQVLF